MSPPDPITAAESAQSLRELNRWLAMRSAEERVAWALENTAGSHALTTERNRSGGGGRRHGVARDGRRRLAVEEAGQVQVRPKLLGCR